MAKTETVTFTQENKEIRTPENYTQVTGIYSLQVIPQFLHGPDNVQNAPADILRMVEQAQAQQQELRFFRVL